jgi:intergrase/recombinase
VLIPLAAIFAGVVKRWLDVKEKQMQALSRTAVERAERYAAQTERLEERVRVLERIATSNGLGVAEEIEQLRDQRPVG